MHVSAEDDVAELRERKEDNKEHDHELNEILGRSVHCHDYSTQ